MKKDKYNISDTEEYLETASVNDCTGLIPRGIKDEDELESYKSLYMFSPTQVNDVITSKKKDH